MVWISMTSIVELELAWWRLTYTPPLRVPSFLTLDRISWFGAWIQFTIKQCYHKQTPRGKASLATFSASPNSHITIMLGLAPPHLPPRPVGSSFLSIFPQNPILTAWQEEKFIFPEAEKRVPGSMAENLAQHKLFHDGFEGLETYFSKVCKDPSIYDGTKVRAMIEEFGTVFAQHLHAEIGTLERSKLVAIWPEEAEFKTLWEEMMDWIIKSASKLTTMPWVPFLGRIRGLMGRWCRIMRSRLPPGSWKRKFRQLWYSWQDMFSRGSITGTLWNSLDWHQLLAMESLWLALGHEAKCESGNREAISLWMKQEPLKLWDNQLRSIDIAQCVLQIKALIKELNTSIKRSMKLKVPKIGGPTLHQSLTWRQNKMSR